MRTSDGMMSVMSDNPYAVGGTESGNTPDVPPPPLPPALPPTEVGVTYAPTVPPTEPLAIWALLCAIGSWVLFPVVLAIVALVLARQADQSIVAAAGWKQGKGLITAARVIAWIHLVLVALVVLFVIAFFVGLAIGG